ncbi:MAG: nucleotidyltransferase family protein [Candidatus Kapaibacterium sp.]
MMTRQEILKRLEEVRNDLFQRYPLTALGLFGSYARENQNDESNIDIIVEFSQPVGFEIVDLAIELESTLGASVDLVSRNGIRDRILAHIEKQIIYV